LHRIFAKNRSVPFFFPNICRRRRIAPDQYRRQNRHHAAKLLSQRPNPTGKLYLDLVRQRLAIKKNGIAKFLCHNRVTAFWNGGTFPKEILAEDELMPNRHLEEKEDSPLFPMSLFLIRFIVLPMR
tara:strand:- start:3053 stop:3430 length:378 start_codon:yes stop_codon:yes gene_type:complete